MDAVFQTGVSKSPVPMETSSTLTMTSNPVRDKCREMLLRGLMTGSECGAIVLRSRLLLGMMALFDS